MNKLPTEQIGSRQLIRLGILLFFLGLIVGLIVPMLANPQMGLSSHLEGIMNGFVLVMLGLIWPRLRLSRLAFTITFWLAIYGTYINWATTLAAAALGVGQSMMPMAALGHKGTPLQEVVINFGLVSLSLAMLTTCIIVLWGLRGADEHVSTELAKQA
jgi:(hydroxyamino)benzene mutase